MNFLQAQEISNGTFSLFFWTQPYQFPFEAYIIAIFSKFLPWNTFGVRVIPIIICFISFILYLFLIKKIDITKNSWTALVLTLFPSTYWLIRQTQILTPQHSITFLFCIICPITIWYNKNSKYIFLSAFFAGLFSGLAISNHLLAASIVLMTTLIICFGSSLKSAIKNSSFYFSGLILGLTPYIYVKLFINGAYEKVADRYPLAEIFNQIWNPIFNEIIPTSLGINTLFYPEVSDKVSTFNFFVTPFSIIFLLILLYLSLERFIKLVKRIFKYRWISFELDDFFIGSTIISIFLMSITKMDLYPRYSLFVVWYFPFLIYYLYKIADKHLKKLISILILFIILINFTNSYQLYNFWNNKKFSHNHAYLPNLKPLYKYFKKNNITHCYAGWWLAYQINVDSKEKITCSPPFNDRFSNWKQPFYKKIVDKNLNTPFIEGVYQHNWLLVSTISSNLKKEHLTYDFKNIGKFKIINNIRNKEVLKSKILNNINSTILVNSNKKFKNYILDDSLDTFWETQENQKENDFIKISLNKLNPIHGLRIFLNSKDPMKDVPIVDIIGIDSNNNEILLKKDYYGIPYPLKLDKSYPRFSYQGIQLFFGFNEIYLKEIKIKIKKAVKNTKWKISEIQLFTEDK